MYTGYPKNERLNFYKEPLFKNYPLDQWSKAKRERKGKYNDVKLREVKPRASCLMADDDVCYVMMHSSRVWARVGRAWLDFLFPNRLSSVSRFIARLLP